jgi:hypothetical protein
MRQSREALVRIAPGRRAWNMCLVTRTTISGVPDADVHAEIVGAQGPTKSPPHYKVRQLAAVGAMLIDASRVASDSRTRSVCRSWRSSARIGGNRGFAIRSVGVPRR